MNGIKETKMEILIVWGNLSNDTEEEAKALRHFIEQSFKDNDAELGFSESDVEIYIIPHTDISI